MNLLFKRVLPVVVILGGALLLFNFLRGPEPVDPAEQAELDAMLPDVDMGEFVPDLPDATEGSQSVDLGPKLAAMVTRVTDVIDGITDQASAEAAATKLQEITAELDGLKGDYQALPDIIRSGFQQNITEALQGFLKIVSEKIAAVPDSASALQPAADALQAKLESFGS